MVNIQEIRDELSDIQTVHLMSGVLRDIAAARSKELRSQFRRNVAFYSEVRDLYAVIRGLSRRRGEMKVPPKSAWGIVVTSNSRFYGGLNRDVTEYFLDNFDQYEDHLVIGSTGEQYVSQTEYIEQCEYKKFHENLPNTSQMRELTKRMEEYDRVDIYYPAFKNSFFQEPTYFDINAAPTQEDDTGKEEVLSESFITEPELDKLHDFFSTHVKWVLFQRVMLETDLAHTSARLIKMHSAEEASEETMERLSNKIRRKRKEDRNTQLLESITALKQWLTAHEDK